MDNKVKFISSNGKEYLRQPCQVYTRIMGYYRPISQANIGKKSEMYSRKYFLEGKQCPRDFDKIDAMIADNNKFISQYS